MVLLAAAIAIAGVPVAPRAVEAARTYIGRDNPDVVADYQLKRLSAEDYSREIDKAITENDVELVASLRALAVQQGVSLPREVLTRAAEAEATGGKSVARDIWDGAIIGEPEGWAGFAATVASDLVVVGDVRDLIKQGIAYPDYDPVVVVLAAAGVVLTGVTVVSLAATFFTGGGAAPSVAAAAPTKVGVSVLKAAKKMRKLHPRLLGELTTLARRSINTDALGSLPRLARRLDWDGLAKTSGKVIRREVAGEIGNTAEALGKIAKGQGYRATLQTLELAQSTKQIGRLGKLSEKFGMGFRGMLRLVPAAVGGLIAGSALLLTVTSWILTGVLWLLMALFVALRLLRMAGRLLRGVFRIFLPKRGATKAASRANKSLLEHKLKKWKPVF